MCLNQFDIFRCRNIIISNDEFWMACKNKLLTNDVYIKLTDPVGRFMFGVYNNLNLIDA